VKYEAQHFPLLKGFTNFTGPYSGVPTPEIDGRWEALMKSEFSSSSPLLFEYSNQGPRLGVPHYRRRNEGSHISTFFLDYELKYLDFYHEYQLTHNLLKQLEGLRDPVKLPDGGYLATLNVHHELHCLVSHKHFISAP
jgi:hypothetical protein